MTTSVNVKKIKELQEQLKAMKELVPTAKSPSGITVKVGEKGNLVIYGLQRFPISLYVSQFEKLMGVKEMIENFIEQNKSEFATKE
jgi:hypothetical protein